MKENERTGKKMCTFPLRNTGVPPRKALKNVHFPMKKWEMPKRQNGPLKNVHFFSEKTGEPPSNVWFSRGQSAFSECALFLGELGEPPGRGPRGD